MDEGPGLFFLPLERPGRPLVEEAGVSIGVPSTLLVTGVDGGGGGTPLPSVRWDPAFLICFFCCRVFLGFLFFDVFGVFPVGVGFVGVESAGVAAPSV